MSIYIPKTINVGYQNRSDTYTGKLAYVIYYDEKGKLRKEGSWQSWRDKNIPNTEFENAPTEGFVLNKKAGDYSTGWDHRKAYCRIYDPRNFEFEITIENLLYILENTTSTKGKGLEGQFVYGWDGKDLILIPVESPDYKTITEFSEIKNKNELIKAKDLKIGATYMDKNNFRYTYMGKYDRWIYCFKKNGKVFSSLSKMAEFCKSNGIEPDEIEKKPYWGRDIEVWHPDEECYYPYEKCYVFYSKSKNKWTDEVEDNFIWLKSTNGKFISCVDENCCENYADIFYKLEGKSEYCPIDISKEKHINYTFEEFEKIINRSNYLSIFCVNGEEISLIRKTYKSDTSIGYKICNSKIADKYGFSMTTVDKYGDKEMIPVSSKEIFDVIQPYYKEIYLENGRFLRREGTIPNE